ncbi:MAG: hypothetical protein AAF645_23985 [Myxococcota bacterium]
MPYRASNITHLDLTPSGVDVALALFATGFPIAIGTFALDSSFALGLLGFMALMGAGTFVYMLRLRATKAHRIEVGVSTIAVTGPELPQELALPLRSVESAGEGQSGFFARVLDRNEELIELTSDHIPFRQSEAVDLLRSLTKDE